MTEPVNGGRWTVDEAPLPFTTMCLVNPVNGGRWTVDEAPLPFTMLCLVNRQPFTVNRSGGAA